MSEIQTLHETLHFERSLRVSPKAVFQAYEDTSTRARWSAPSDSEAVIYSGSDFRVGGVDLYLCGERNDPRFKGKVHYLEIVPARRIVYSELISIEEKNLAASLVTWEFFPDLRGSRLQVTAQVASFVGEGMISGTRSGMSAALDNLVRLLDS